MWGEVTRGETNISVSFLLLIHCNTDSPSFCILNERVELAFNALSHVPTDSVGNSTYMFCFFCFCFVFSTLRQTMWRREHGHLWFSESGGGGGGRGVGGHLSYLNAELMIPLSGHGTRNPKQKMQAECCRVKTFWGSLPTDVFRHVISSSRCWLVCEPHRISPYIVLIISLNCTDDSSWLKWVHVTH